MKEIIILLLTRLIPLLIGINLIYITHRLNKNKKRLDKIEDVCNINRKFDFKIVDFTTENLERIKQLEYKLTEPKYNELMEYLENHKREVKYCFRQIWCDNHEITYHIGYLVISNRACSSLRFKNKKINLHPDQIKSLFNKAEEYWKAKELLKEDTILEQDAKEIRDQNEDIKKKWKETDKKFNKKKSKK